MPNGEIWKNIVTEDKAEAGRDAGRVPRQLQIQSARQERARVQRRGPDLLAVGRPRGDQQLVAGRAAHPRRASSARNTSRRTRLLLAARAQPRVPRIHADARHAGRSRAASIARSPTGRCSTCSCSTCAATAAPTAKAREESYGPDAYFLGPTQVAWLKRELLNSRATWKVIAADMPIGLIVVYDADRKWGVEAIAQGDGPAARPRARDRRPPRLHQARRHPQHGLAHGRRALHRRALLRSQQGGVPGFRAVLGIRLRPDPRRQLRPRTQLDNTLRPAAAST